jgi:hypothetical protein
MDPCSRRCFQRCIGGRLVGLSLTLPRIPWPLRVLPLAFILPVELFIWYAIKPPVLKADAMEVSIPGPLFRQRMLRSDLALIYRGQFNQGDGKRVIWVKMYLFVARDGKIGIKAAEVAFFPEGIGEFAQRLGLPLRGDFSEKLKDTVDLSTTESRPDEAGSSPTC